MYKNLYLNLNVFDVVLSADTYSLIKHAIKCK